MTKLDDEKLQELFAWVDEIPISRPKKTITRDFSDGVLVAEVIHHFIPRLVEIHNYTPANSTTQKQSNWGTLNRKVLSKLNYNVPESVVRGITNNKAGVVEEFLWKLKHKIEVYLNKKSGNPSKGKVKNHDIMIEGAEAKGTKKLETQEQDPVVDTHGTRNVGTQAPASIGVHVVKACGTREVGTQMSPDGYYDGQEVGSIHQRTQSDQKPPKPERVQGGRPPPVKTHTESNAPFVHHSSSSNLQKTRSLNKLNDWSTDARIIIEEKEQALLASNETVQILQAKVRRLEHLLHLKDIRIEELTKRVEKMGAKY